MPNQSEIPEPIDLPEERRRRRLVVVLLVSALVAAAIGMAAALVLPHHHSPAPHSTTPSHGLLFTTIQAAATLGVLALCIPVLRSASRAARLGTAGERRDLASQTPQDRRAMLAAARSGEPYQPRPDLQRLAVRRELVRGRWSRVSLPLLAVLSGVNAVGSRHLLVQVTGGLAAVLLAASSVQVWRNVARLEGFLRDPRVGSVPFDSH